MESTDWRSWHEAYDRQGSGLDGRLACVRSHLTAFLDATAPHPVRVVSLCAGDGRDLLGVLAGRDDADRVTGLLVELDPDLAARARSRAAEVAPGLTVHTGDAALSDRYRDHASADLVLLCGIFGNISDDDVRATVRAAPQLCSPDAQVVWTRHRGAPDLTPSVRGWFARAGFAEVAFDSEEPPQVASRWAVGVHRYTGPPVPLTAGRSWFRFVR